MPRKYYLEAVSPLGLKIHTTKLYWDYIAQRKHPEIRGQKRKAVATIEKPDIIKQSLVDNEIFVYYRRTRGKYFCVVTREVHREGFVITAYITRKFIKGEIVWQKPKK